MSLTGQALVDYARGKKGTPYFYGSKMAILKEDFMAEMHKIYPSIVTENYIKKAVSKGQVGKENTDCSGLVSGYTGKILGSAQLYQQAYTRLSPSTYKSWANGVVAWRKGHVGVFFEENGNYYVAEAKGIDYGTIISVFDPNKWSKGLTFPWMDYSYTDNVVADATWKEVNPYTEPTETILIGSIGESVKWVQWELVEAGYDIAIDGDFGEKTDEAVKAFQSSCKITVDGKVGQETRKYLSANVQKTTETIPNNTQEIYGIVSGNGVNVRKGPSTSYDSVEIVNKGQRVRIWKQSGNWYMIDNGKWIHTDYVSIENSTPTPTTPVAPVIKEVLTVDGDWGKDTTSKSQEVLNTGVVDGIVSNQSAKLKQYVPNASTSSWEFKDEDYENGSALIKAIQTLVGCKADGICGKNTVIAIQKFLADLNLYTGKIDGIMGEKTVKAWQTYINSKL